jgi:23S rRNA pseudouridine1911/1915/1917 synthase
MQQGNDDRALEQPTILQETEYYLVINKPAGWLVHEDGKTEAPTVVDWALAQVPTISGVGELGYTSEGVPLNRSGVVHRLDRDTSGVMVLAKTQDVHGWLKQQFHDRTIFKEYRAFVYGRIHDRWGTINRPIGRSAKDSRLRSAMPGATGTLREAITDFERIGAAEYQGESFSYVKLMPKTGRTHQLRAHLRAVDRPIVGDTLYADYKIKTSNNLGFTRLALHAHILEWSLPGGAKERFIAPLPAQFEVAADYLEQAVETE